MNRYRVAVVGAGIAGLSCARALTEGGIETVVYEREPTPGGRMNTRFRAGFAFDFGAAFLAQCYSHLHALAERVGIPVVDVGSVRHVVVRGGSMHHLAFSRIRDILRFEPLSPATRAKLLVFAVPTIRQYSGVDFFDLSTVPEELNAENAYDYCASRVGQDFADYVVDPFCTTMMFHRSTEITAGAFIALFTMMGSSRYSFGVQRAIGGMRALPRALARHLDVRQDAAVTAVQALGSGIIVTTTGEYEYYDAAVLACPAVATRRLLRNRATSVRSVLDHTTYSCTIDVSFRIPVATLDGIHCIYVPFVESPLIAEMTNEAIKGMETVQGETTLLNVGLHDGMARPLLAASDGAIFDAVKAELLRLCDPLALVADQIVPHDLQRWPQAIPRYGGAHVERVRHFLDTQQGNEGIWLCGDYLNRPWLEGAVRSGEQVAVQILQERRRVVGG